MIKIDYSLIIQIINFLFLIWVLNSLVFRPIRNILTQRRDKIDGMEQTSKPANGMLKKRRAPLPAVSRRPATGG